MEKRFAGPRAITIQGLMAGTLDITQNDWGHEVYVYISTIHNYIRSLKNILIVLVI